MLTCKSLFGLGYRGERLIEPLMLDLYLSIAWWSRVRSKIVASHCPIKMARLEKWQDRQIAGTRCHANSRAAKGKLIAALKSIA